MIPKIALYSIFIDPKRNHKIFAKDLKMVYFGLLFNLMPVFDLI